MAPLTHWPSRLQIAHPRSNSGRHNGQPPDRRRHLRANLVVRRKSGAGQVSGGVVVELRRTRRSWPRGRWRFRKTGWSESIAPTTRASWRRYAAASSAGGRMAQRNCRNGLPSVSAWNRRTARRVGRASRGGTRRPATRNGPYLLTSIANIGPVPFSVLPSGVRCFGYIPFGQLLCPKWGRSFITAGSGQRRKPLRLGFRNW